VARSRVYKIADMSRDVWESAFEELTAIPSIDKKLDGTPQSMNTAGETAGFTS
jgi:hypothetical protein